MSIIDSKETTVIARTFDHVLIWDDHRAELVVLRKNGTSGTYCSKNIEKARNAMIKRSLLGSEIGIQISIQDQIDVSFPFWLESNEERFNRLTRYL